LDHRFQQADFDRQGQHKRCVVGVLSLRIQVQTSIKELRTPSTLLTSSGELYQRLSASHAILESFSKYLSAEQSSSSIPLCVGLPFYTLLFSHGCSLVSGNYGAPVSIGLSRRVGRRLLAH